jgi:hypothetical protein
MGVRDRRRTAAERRIAAAAGKTFSVTWLTPGSPAGH